MIGTAGADKELRWYAMRDLSRRHSKGPAYKTLAAMGMEIFTPMTRRVVVEGGRRTSREEPFMSDLLFVHDRRPQLDEVVEKIENLQYRYACGGYCKPMVVPDGDMERFMRAVRSTVMPRYYRPEEITPAMCGKQVRIVGGSLDGYEGHLLSVRGLRRRRLMVTLPNFLVAAVEVDPELMEFLE